MRPPSGLLLPTELLTVSLPFDAFQQTSPEPLLELVIVRVGGELFGVDVESAFEIRGLESLIQTQDRRLVVSIRGQDVPVVDLGLITGGHAVGTDCPAMLLVQSAVQLFALAVDEVLVIESLSAWRVEPAAHGDRFAELCPQGVQLGTGKRVAVIDPRSALSIQQRLEIDSG